MNTLELRRDFRVDRRLGLDDSGAQLGGPLAPI
jgi:hypothetical protein